MLKWKTNCCLQFSSKSIDNHSMIRKIYPSHKMRKLVFQIHFMWKVGRKQSTKRKMDTNNRNFKNILNYLIEDNGDLIQTKMHLNIENDYSIKVQITPRASMG